MQFWGSLDAVNALGTLFQWLIVLFSVLALLFSSRAATLQDIETNRNKEAMEQKIRVTKEIADSSYQKLEPRSINAVQRKEFLEISQSFPKGPVLITAITADAESLTFSSHLAGLLRDAGYSVEENSILFVDVVPIGIKMFIGQEKVASFSIPLKECIERIGYKIELSDPLEKKREIPEIIVGKKE